MYRFVKYIFMLRMYKLCKWDNTDETRFFIEYTAYY